MQIKTSKQMLFLFLRRFIIFASCFWLSSNGKFILNYPRPYDLLLGQPVDHGENVTKVNLYIHGWFDREVDEPNMPINIKLYLNRQLVLDSFMDLLLYGQDVVEIVFQQYLKIDVVQIDFCLVLTDADKSILYETDENQPITLVIMPQQQYEEELFFGNGKLHHQEVVNPSEVVNESHIITVLRECFVDNIHISTSSLASSPQQLDYIELGTSDFETIIQQVQTLRQTSARIDPSSPRPFYSGLSIDAIGTYLNRLPLIPGACKINSAIIPGNISLASQTQKRMTLPWQSIYYIPAYYLENYLPTESYLKGIAEVNRVSPYYVSLLRLKALPSPALIRRQWIPSLSISILMQIVHQYYPQGVNLLKIDLEGMDLALLEELLAYYRWKSSASTNSSTTTNSRQDHWPCFLYFESNTYHHINFTMIYAELRNHYRLLHDYSEIVDSVPALQQLFGANKIAINCDCSEESRRRAWELIGLLPVIESHDTILQQVCR